MQPASPKHAPQSQEQLPSGKFGQEPAVQKAGTPSPTPPLIPPRYLEPPLPPRYPPQAIRLGPQGEVMVHALVDEHGKVQTLFVHRSSGHRLLDQAAQEAVARWRFVPASKDGHQIPSWVQVPVRFVLESG